MAFSDQYARAREASKELAENSEKASKVTSTRPRARGKTDLTNILTNGAARQIHENPETGVTVDNLSLGQGPVNFYRPSKIPERLRTLGKQI